MTNLGDFFDFLSKTQRRVFMDVAGIRIGWVRSTFYYKVRHGNLTMLEEKVLAEITNDFVEKFESYRQMVIDFIKGGGVLESYSHPRKGVKQVNKRISKLYEVSTNECPTETR